MILFLRLLAAYGGLLAVGAVTCAAGGLARGRTRLERVALALPLGSAVVSILAFWLSLVGVAHALDVTSAVVAAVAIGALALAADSWIPPTVRLRAARGRAVASARRPLALPEGTRPMPLAAATRLDGAPGRVLRARARRRRVWVAATAVLVATALVAAVAIGRFAWDGLMVWGLKARIFALEGRVPTAYFVDISRQWSHLNYPLGLPLTEAWIYRVAGGPHEGYTKPLFLGYLFSVLVLLYVAARRGLRADQAPAAGRAGLGAERARSAESAGRVGTATDDAMSVQSAVGGGLSPEQALALLAVLALTPLVLPLTSWGYADLPLATLILGSATSLWLWLEHGEPRALLLAGVLAAAGPWTKREGAVFWVIAAALVALAPAATPRDGGPASAKAAWSWRSRGRDLLRFAWPAVALLPWFVFLWLHRVPDSDFAVVSGGELLHRLVRAPELAWLVLSDLASVSEWAVLWLLVAAVALRSWKRPWSALERWFTSIVVAYVGVLSCSYLLSTWTPWQPHVTLSVARLIFHVTPVALWLTALRWRAHEVPDSAAGAAVQEAAAPTP